MDRHHILFNKKEGELRGEIDYWQYQSEQCQERMRAAQDEWNRRYREAVILGNTAYRGTFDDPSKLSN